MYDSWVHIYGRALHAYVTIVKNCQYNFSPCKIHHVLILFFLCTFTKLSIQIVHVTTYQRVPIGILNELNHIVHTEQCVDKIRFVKNCLGHVFKISSCSGVFLFGRIV